MSITKTKEALEFYGYTVKPKESDIIKVKDRTNYPKRIWEHYYDIEEILVALEKDKLIEDDVIYDPEIEITLIENTFNNKIFWHRHSKIKDLKSLLELEYQDEGQIDTLNPLSKDLIENNLVDIEIPTENDKTQYLNQLTVAELRDLSKAIGMKSSGKKSEIIERIGPEIPTENIPRRLILKEDFFHLTKKIKKIYATEAAKSLSSLPISMDARIEIISEGLFNTSNLSKAELEKIVMEYISYYKQRELIQQRPIAKSEKVAIGALALGFVITILLLYFLPGMSWWVYLIIGAVTAGTYYAKAIEIHANESITDKS